MVEGINLNRTNLINSYINKLNKENKLQNNSQSIELPSNVTPDFNIKIPQSYLKLGVEKLSNGQEIHSYKLANGQKVLIAPMKEAPRTYINTYVNTGATNEKDSERGISHFTEHMAFNGTFGTNGYLKLGKGDVFRKVAEMGGTTNACTGLAETNYTIGIPLNEKEDLETAISIQASMMNNLEMSDDMVEKEHGPVCSEINMYSDMMMTKANNIATKELYSIPSSSEDLVAGRVDNIQNVNRKKVTDYYKNNYYPANMTTVITGNVTPDDAIKLIAKHFKGENPKNPERKFEKMKPIQKTVRKDVFSNKSKQTYASMAFNGPTNNDFKGQVALDAAFAILFGKSNSRIKSPLKVLNTEISPTTNKMSTIATDNNIINFDIETTEENSEKALNEVFKQLQNFKIKDNTELEQIKDYMKSRNQDNYENCENLNYTLGRNSFYIDEATLAKEDNIIESLTIEDIENAVHNYMDTSKCSIAVVHPSSTSIDEIQKKHTEANNNNSQVSFKGISKLANEQQQVLNLDNISKYHLNNNYDIAFYDTPNNTNAKALISFTPQKTIQTKPGVIDMLNRMLTNKSAYKDIDEFGNYLDNSNIIQDISISQKGEIQIRGKMPSKNIDNFIAISQEQIMAPCFDEATFNKQKNILKDIYSHSDPNAFENLNAEIFKGSYLGYTTKEILKNLDNITLQDLKDTYNQIMTNSHATVAVAAPTADRQVINTTLNRFAQMPMSQPELYKDEELYKPAEKSKVITESTPNAQADIIQAYKFKVNRNMHDNESFILMNLILSGGDETGLFNNLREKEKLAYAVHSQCEMHEDTGVLSCEILTTTDNKEIGEQSYDNVKKSIDGFTRQINKMRNGEFTDKELEVAKKELKDTIKNFTYSQESKSKILSEGLKSIYGLNKINERLKVIDSITKQDIINSANYIFSNKPTYSIVASEDTLNANKEYLKALEN